MGCCIALAYLVAWTRRAWLSLVARTPAAATPFAPPARRPAPPTRAELPRPVTRATPTGHPVAAALVVGGVAWFALGIVGMHALGWFAWVGGSVIGDTAFHASGLWVAAVGVAVAAVRS